MRSKDPPAVGDMVRIIDNNVCQAYDSWNIAAIDGTLYWSGFGYSGCKDKAKHIRQFEDRDCENNNQGAVYKFGHTIPPIAPITAVSGRYTSNGYGYWIVKCGQPLYAYYNMYSNGHFSCKSEYAVSNTPDELMFWFAINANDSTNNCGLATNASCEACSWPYASVYDTVQKCGCSIDRSHYQSPEKLASRVYLYCQTYSDPSGVQFYLDRSRSNFDPSKGEIYGACSAPGVGTVYMPAQTCPTGSALDTVITNDTTLQHADGSIPRTQSGSGSGTGSDTATHSRLDSILGRLDTLIARQGGGTGSDSALINYLDTVGSGNADTGYFTSEVQDAKAGLDTALNGLPALTSAVSDHASRGDTAGISGYTLDSLINLCVTNGDSLICLSQQTIYPTIIQVAKWIIRICLFFWGLLMFAFFLSLAKGD